MTISANRLIIEMARACISDKELCEKSGVSRPTLITIKRNGGNPKPATVGKLARALGVSVECLIYEAGENACKSGS